MRARWHCLVFAAASVLAAGETGDEFPYFVPIQIIRPTPDHTSIAVTSAVEQLRGVTTPIALIAVVGPYHSGKSFLLNALTEGTGVFTVGRKTSPETMGVWLCRTKYKAQDGAEVWLMDSEGFFGPGVSEDYDAKIFTLATLLGSYLVYNTIKIIDQQAVNLLEMLTRRAKLFRVRSQAPGMQEIPGFLTAEHFPSLVWVVEDFVQDLSGSSPSAWLTSYTTGQADDNVTGAETYFDRVFPSVSVHTLFLPAVRATELQDLSQTEWSQLTPEFKAEVGQLRRHLLETVRAKPFDGGAGGMTGPEFATAVHFVARSLSEGFFPDLPSLWESWQLQVAALSVEDAARWFRDASDVSDAVAVPVSVPFFAQESLDRRREAVAFYKSLIADFNVSPRLEALSQILCERQAQSVAVYQEKVRAHVALRASVLKKSMHAVLDVPMPRDPVAFVQGTEAEAQSLERTLAQEVAALGGEIRDIGLESYFQAWPTPSLPAFVEEPSAALRADLDALRLAAARENERLVLQDFKASVEAAAGGVRYDLEARAGALLGDASVAELERVTVLGATQAFEAALTEPWHATSEHYKSHRALVEEEVRGLLSRFASKNRAAIVEFLGNQVSLGKQTYEDKKWELERRELPCETEVLRAAHSQKAHEVLQALESAAGDVADTDAFREARQELDSAIQEKYGRLQAKNVELWKVHSDEATSCAIKLTAESKAKCAFGFLCMEHMVPYVHRREAQRRLNQCFEQNRRPVGGAGSRTDIPVSMRDEVFQVWYSQDLAKEASGVYMTMVYMGTTLAAVGGMIFWSAATRATTYAPASTSSGTPFYRPTDPGAFYSAETNRYY